MDNIAISDINNISVCVGGVGDRNAQSVGLIKLSLVQNNNSVHNKKHSYNHNLNTVMPLIQQHIVMPPRAVFIQDYCIMKMTIH